MLNREAEVMAGNVLLIKNFQLNRSLRCKQNEVPARACERVFISFIFVLYPVRCC